MFVMLNPLLTNTTYIDIRKKQEKKKKFAPVLIHLN